MIRAYPHDISVSRGATLVLHVEGAEHEFWIRIYRCGKHFAEVAGPLGPFRREKVEIAIGRSWRPGVYVVHCSELRAATLDGPDARKETALFVVRSDCARVVMNLPVFTYHAYNCVVPGGDCLYTGPTRVSLHRPGGGTGAHLWDERHVDVYDPASPRQTFAHWDAKALRWLETARYDPAVCCDVDLDAGRLPEHARVLLAFGHFEYWTPGMRRTIEDFLHSGGNVAVFAGNTSWFRVNYEESRHELSRAGKWSEHDPEERVLGTSYRFGGGWWHGSRPNTGFSVKSPSHWVFSGTRLRNGDRFGSSQALVGYEFDGSSESEEELACASALEWNVDSENGEMFGGRAGVVLRQVGDGTLFNAATVDWARVLERDPTIAYITRNVIDRLSM